MSYKRKTQNDRRDMKKLKTEKNNTDLCFPQDTCKLNVFLRDQTDQKDLSRLGDKNQDKDPQQFTSDQSEVQSDDAEVLLIGDHETQESEGGEADLHKCLIDCQKNPGHRKFIPVDSFTLENLPKSLQDQYLYEYIKAIADLTVRVDVRMSSPHRPEFWPKTTQPYPFYNMFNKKNLRMGTGRMWNVFEFQNGDNTIKRCWCRKCKDSDSPSNVWWEFNVYTAAHVVFDDIEANHTTLTLFYDREGCRVDMVDMVSVSYVKIENDVCRLLCVTCDEKLGNKLRKLDKQFTNAMFKIFDKYKAFRYKRRFLFIVSHPHGCSKQVSVGKWKKRLKVGNRLLKFTYTTCTCPGSSGAHVHCLGYDHRSYISLVHSGTLKSGINYSGVWAN